MPVGEFCTREVVITEPDATVVEAARLMREHHVGDVIVVERRGDGAVPVGIVTDRDLTLEVLAEEVEADRVRVGDVMTTELITAPESEDLFSAVRRMSGAGVRRMPIVGAQGALVGILAIDDVIELLSEMMSDLTRDLARERAREQRLRERP